VIVLPRYALVDLLLYRSHPGDCGLVFVRTKKQAEDIAQKLLDHGINADHFHGGQRERLHEVLQKFHSGTANVIVCTVFDEPPFYVEFS
jgi:superfamily II DNA helicase RecQ